MTKAQALDQAAREAGYEDKADMISKVGTWISITDRAMELYAEAAFEAAREIITEEGRNMGDLYPTFEDWTK